MHHKVNGIASQLTGHIQPSHQHHISTDDQLISGLSIMPSIASTVVYRWYRPRNIEPSVGIVGRLIMIDVFLWGFSVLFLTLAGSGPVRKVYVPDTARIVISL